MLEFSLFGVPTQLLSFSAIPLAGCIAAVLLYIRACDIVETRGRSVSGGQRGCFYAGIALILIATQTFIDPVGEHSLLSLHMAQHLLIADLPAPLLLYGLRAPVLYFFWPKPILVAAARNAPLRALWAWLRQPHIAISVWLGTLYAWHIPIFYEAALTNRLVHDLEHLSFALTGILVWWPLMDPTHHRVEGRVWKAGYVFAARMIGGVLGIVLISWPAQIYSTYGDAALAFGLSPRTDQQIAGAMMMFVDAAVVFIGVTYFLVTMDRGTEYGSDDLPEAARLAALAEYERNAAR